MIYEKCSYYWLQVVSIFFIRLISMHKRSDFFLLPFIKHIYKQNSARVMSLEDGHFYAPFRCMLLLFGEFGQWWWASESDRVFLYYFGRMCRAKRKIQNNISYQRTSQPTLSHCECSQLTMEHAKTALQK